MANFYVMESKDGPILLSKQDAQEIAHLLTRVVPRGPDEAARLREYVLKLDPDIDQDRDWP